MLHTRIGDFHSLFAVNRSPVVQILNAVPSFFGTAAFLSFT